MLSRPVALFPLCALLLAALCPPGPARAALPAGDARGAWWVFFNDKGNLPPSAAALAIESARAALTPRAIARRARSRGDAPVDLLDVPVRGDYVRQVLGSGAGLRATSRWLNAVSVNATPGEIGAIRALPFVRTVREVARGRRMPEPEVRPVPAAGMRRAEPRPVTPATLDYGQCASQLLPIQVDRLHDLGLSGAGVLVALMDTGFEHQTHVAVQGIHVVAERDFINGDNITADQPGDPAGQMDHGSWVLSLIGGYAPGNLIGPAYGASYLLAKTEDISSETPVEEDYWIAAAEWADSLGADIISTSLQYIDWYTYHDMDGDTAPITIAADLAGANGIAVFASAGNSGGSEWYFIGAPADGDSVIAVGAVDSLDTIAWFSSHGPTYDGRTKPDICAMGMSDLVALVGTVSEYGRGSGTSFSCPLAAGVGALLLQERPGWTPMDLRGALRTTASRSTSPDQSYGWGIIRAWDASRVVTAIHPPATGPGVTRPLVVSPNPSDGPFTLSIAAGSAPGDASVTIVSVGGRLVREIWAGRLGTDPLALRWDARDAHGERVPGGVYYARLRSAAGETTRPIVVLR